MEKYHYTDGKTNYGPFTIEELKGKGITPDTFIWTAGFDEWKKAGTVAELSTILTAVPPQIQPSVKSSRQLLDMLLLGSLIYWLFNSLVQRLAPLFIEQLGFQYMKVYPYLHLVLNLIFMFIPVVMACSIRNKTIRMIGIVISIIIAVMLLVSSIIYIVETRRFVY